ncbi:MAG: solute carrier family 23 protein [Elusimicrobiaceae bacterium]
MPKKPANLIYGVDENPPWGISLLLGCQHIFLLSIAFIFPVIIVSEIGGSPEDAQNLICMAMLATGFSTILQGLRKGPVGSGYLCPLLNGPAFVPASLMAGNLGGFPLIFGMTFVGGLFEGLFSRIVSRMRAIFPAEVTGTVVLMVGIEVIPIAIPKFFGVDKLNADPSGRAVFVALITLMSMVGFNVWGRGKMRLYSVLIGMAIGYIAAFSVGLLDIATIRHLINEPVFRMPAIGKFGMSFSVVLIIPFMIATLSSALKTMGDLTTCQKINDADWRRMDMKSISRGLLACGTGNVISGLLGALGQSVSSSNIGLSIATGATSRRIAYTTGAILILLAFLPKLASIFVIMPVPIMGATLMFSVSFMILAGVQIIMSRMIDARKTFVIGLSIIFGLGMAFSPGISAGFPLWIKPLFGSSLAIATICAIVMNLLFRIGIAKRKTITVTAENYSSDVIADFMEIQGAAWGARKEVVQRALSALNEFMEAVISNGLTKSPVELAVSFDEFNLDAEFHYEGELMEFAEKRPSKAELLEHGTAKLSGFIIRSYVDKISAEQKDGKCAVKLHFEH